MLNVLFLLLVLGAASQSYTEAFVFFGEQHNEVEGQHTVAADADLITDLPGLDHSTYYKQYSGYLDAGTGTFLHYWFIESKPSDAPLLLWLNGGPGCSSLDGLINELGPFHVKDDGETLYNNTASWNTFANIVYIESPACVGFSYNINNDCSASDDSTSQRNYNALQSFFAKFPAFRTSPFFVTGESYGGIYVPTLSVRIVQNNANYPINFKGFAVGNGLLNDVMNDDSIIFFANYHGLLGKILWNDLVSHCCDSDIPSQDTCHFSNNAWPVCTDRVGKAMDIIFNEGLNMYNLYDVCLTGSQANFSRYIADKKNLLQQHSYLKNLRMDPPCTNSNAISSYLNSAAVRTAIHIPAHVPKWEICNDEVNAKFVRQYSDMAAQYKTLQAAGVRGLVYNGDVDMACNFIGDQWFVESLNFKETATRRMWHSQGQVGGFVKQFELLDLLTIRGSGHMVPQDKPFPSLHMIKAFVLNAPY
uniref:Carboxypeptidase n=1 Tax=Hirondellea gigas TaxID=1518452 RepID=A0A2P2HX72_9CRUS